MLECLVAKESNLCLIIHKLSVHLPDQSIQLLFGDELLEAEVLAQRPEIRQGDILRLLLEASKRAFDASRAVALGGVFLEDPAEELFVLSHDQLDGELVVVLLQFELKECDVRDPSVFLVEEVLLLGAVVKEQLNTHILFIQRSQAELHTTVVNLLAGVCP